MAFQICPNCKGRGIEPGTGITFTASDLDEWAGDGYEDRREVARSWCEYGEVCTACRGANVMTKAAAARWRREAREREAYEAEVAAEARYFSYARF